MKRLELMLRGGVSFKREGVAVQNANVEGCDKLSLEVELITQVETALYKY
jgi:hypothetical protein